VEQKCKKSCAATYQRQEIVTQIEEDCTNYTGIKTLYTSIMVLDSRGLFFRKIRVIREIVSNPSQKAALEINFWLVL